MDNIMKIIGATIIALIIGCMIGAVAFSSTETIINEIEVPVEKIVTINSTIVEEIEVDNGNLEMVLDYLDDMGLVDKDDIVEEIEFKNLALTMAIQEIEDNGLDEFDDTDYRDGNGFEDYKDSELSLRNIKGDMDEVEFTDCDVEDEEAEIEVEVKIRGKDSDGKVEVSYIFTVEIEDGEAEIVDIDEA